MIDTDADGKITEKDLEVFLGNLGENTIGCLYAAVGSELTAVML